MKKILFAFALLTAVSIAGAQQTSHAAVKGASSQTGFSPPKGSKCQELNNAMQELWSAHMYRTLITVDAFYNDPKGLDAKLYRLLRNQQDIAAAIVPFYGQKAGDKLAALLTIHIKDAVPVLKAAKNGDTAALDSAVKDWYANAKDIGHFLAAANPKHWTAEQTEAALKIYITHTIAYSVSILKGIIHNHLSVLRKRCIICYHRPICYQTV